MANKKRGCNSKRRKFDAREAYSASDLPVLTQEQRIKVGEDVLRHAHLKAMENGYNKLVWKTAVKEAVKSATGYDI